MNDSPDIDYRSDGWVGEAARGVIAFVKRQGVTLPMWYRVCIDDDVFIVSIGEARHLYQASRTAVDYGIGGLSGARKIIQLRYHGGYAIAEWLSSR